MNVYRVSQARPGREPSYHATLKEAHTTMKNEINTSNYSPWCDLIDVPTDKVGLVAMLNSDLGAAGIRAIRQWDLTPRGGLLEVTDQLEQPEVKP